MRERPRFYGACRLFDLAIAHKMGSLLFSLHLLG